MHHRNTKNDKNTNNTNNHENSNANSNENNNENNNENKDGERRREQRREQRRKQRQDSYSAVKAWLCAVREAAAARTFSDAINTAISAASDAVPTFPRGLRLAAGGDNDVRARRREERR